MIAWSHFTESSEDWDRYVLALGGQLHQCYGWGQYRAAMGWEVARLLARDTTGGLAATAQLLLRKKAGVTIVWLPGGPSGEVQSAAASLSGFLRREFGPQVYCRANYQGERDAAADSSLTQAGWRRPTARLASGLSMELDLRLDPAQRLSQASNNWRHNLKRSSKYGLAVERWETPDLDRMGAIYKEMSERKGFAEQHTPQSLTHLFAALRPQLLTYRCLDSGGELLAFRTALCFGGHAMDMLAGATIAARKVYATHATLWALFDACRDAGIVSYDMGGIDPEGNKGVYDFKQGTGAKRVEYQGEWEWAGMPLLASAAGWMMKRKGLAA